MSVVVGSSVRGRNWDTRGDGDSSGGWYRIVCGILLANLPQSVCAKKMEKLTTSSHGSSNQRSKGNEDS